MKQLRYPLSILLLIIHLLSGVSSAFSGNQKQLLTVDGNAVMIICTGQGVTYIDLDHYYLTGELEFVDADTKQQTDQYHCPVCLSYSNVDDDTDALQSLFSPAVESNTAVLTLLDANRRISKFPSYFSRAPPSFT